MLNGGSRVDGWIVGGSGMVTGEWVVVGWVARVLVNWWDMGELLGVRSFVLWVGCGRAVG